MFENAENILQTIPNPFSLGVKKKLSLNQIKQTWNYTEGK